MKNTKQNPQDQKDLRHQQQKDQRQKSLREQTPKMTALKGKVEDHEQEHPETRMTR